MPYPDNLLVAGEKIYVRKRPHWKVLILPTLFFVLIVGGGAAIIAFANSRGWDWPSWADWAIVAVAVIALIILVVVPFIRWRTEHFVISNHHIFFRTGLLSRREHQIPLGQIANIETEVTFWGRLMGYGSLIVESSADQPLKFRNVANLSKVQSMLNQLIRNEKELTHRGMVEVDDYAADDSDREGAGDRSNQAPTGQWAAATDSNQTGGYGPATGAQPAYGQVYPPAQGYPPAAGYAQPGYGQAHPQTGQTQGYPPPGQPQGYPPPGPTQGYPAGHQPTQPPGYPPSGYATGGYPPNGYQQPGYAPNGYQQPGYQQPGHASGGYPPPAAPANYSQPGPPQPGYSQSGYSQAGYAQPGSSQPAEGQAAPPFTPAAGPGEQPPASAEPTVMTRLPSAAPVSSSDSGAPATPPTPPTSDRGRHARPTEQTPLPNFAEPDPTVIVRSPASSGDSASGAPAGAPASAPAPSETDPDQPDSSQRS